MRILNTLPFRAHLLNPKLEKLINETFGKVTKFLNATVAKERPPATYVFAALHVHFNHHILLFVDR